MLQARQNTSWMAIWGELGIYPVALSHAAEITGFIKHLCMHVLNHKTF